MMFLRMIMWQIHYNNRYCAHLKLLNLNKVVQYFIQEKENKEKEKEKEYPSLFRSLLATASCWDMKTRMPGGPGEFDAVHAYGIPILNVFHRFPFILSYPAGSWTGSSCRLLLPLKWLQYSNTCIEICVTNRLSFLFVGQIITFHISLNLSRGSGILKNRLIFNLLSKEKNKK